MERPGRPWVRLISTRPGNGSSEGAATPGRIDNASHRRHRKLNFRPLCVNEN